MQPEFGMMKLYFNTVFFTYNMHPPPIRLPKLGCMYQAGKLIFCAKKKNTLL